MPALPPSGADTEGMPDAGRHVAACCRLGVCEAACTELGKMAEAGALPGPAAATGPIWPNCSWGEYITSTGQFSLTVMDDGGVHGTGEMWLDFSNEEEGLLQPPTALAGMRGQNVLQVSAGSCHALLLLEGGLVMSLGYGESGVLGHGHTRNEATPRLIEALQGKVVVQVSAGASLSLVLLDGGGVMSFGSAASGQLGHGDLRELEEVHTPRLIEALQGKKVLQVSAGHSHCLALLAGGDVMSFGWGRWGQLGHGTEYSEPLPKLIEVLLGSKVLQVSAGGLHSLLLLEGGAVMSFGDGGHGQLGHGDLEDRFLPEHIEVLQGKKAVQVSAGGHHSLVLLEGGLVMSFGHGFRCRLGHSSEFDQWTPKVIESLRGKQVLEVAAGDSHSLVRLQGTRVERYGDLGHMDVGHGEAAE